jgi:hypothetical protein
MDTDLVSGGFYVTHLLQRPDGLAKLAPLPEWLLTLSDCLTELLPNAWALEWSSSSQAEREQAIGELGIASEKLGALMTFATEAFDQGALGWPCVWQSLAAARAVKASFAEADPTLVILELGVPMDYADKLLVELAPTHGEGKSGFYLRLESRARLDDGGVPVGWEPLGVEAGGSYHSWLCNGLQDHALAQLGIIPGAFGLISTPHEARGIVTLIEGGLGAEPVPWFPGLLRRFE